MSALLADLRRKATQRRVMYEEADWRCRKCHERCPERMDALPGQRFLTLDHVVPRSAGGPSEAWNLAVLCDQCNHDKGSKHDLSVWEGHPPWQYYALQARMRARTLVAA